MSSCSLTILSIAFFGISLIVDSFDAASPIALKKFIHKARDDIANTAQGNNIMVVPSVAPVKITGTKSIFPTIASTMRSTALPQAISALPTSSPLFSIAPSQNGQSKTIKNPTAIPTTFHSTASPSLSPLKPSSIPTQPTVKPSSTPTFSPSKKPTSLSPSPKPSTVPSKPSAAKPTAKLAPSVAPSVVPSKVPFVDDINYHPNISILTGPLNVYTIFLGDFSAPEQQQTVSLMNYMTAHVGNSSWYAMMSHYYQVNADGTRTHVTPKVNFAGSINLHAGLQRQNYSDQLLISDLYTVLATQFPYDPNGVYSFFMRGDWNYEGWLGFWCGFHSAYPIGSGKVVKLLLVGDPGTAPKGGGAACEAIRDGSPTANGNLGADNMATVYGHELAETVTDSLGAWYFDTYTDDGYDGTNIIEECADACVWKFGSNLVGNSNVRFGQKSFLVQQIWVPHYGCRLSL